MAYDPRNFINTNITQCIYCLRHTVGPCSCTRQIPLPPVALIQPKQEHTPEFILEYHRKWKYLHTLDTPTPEKLEDFIISLPNFCACTEDLRKIIKRIPPRYDDWFRWTWEAHNEVNKTLNKPHCSFITALRINQPRPIYKKQTIPIVTALGCNRIERQQYCISTWLDSGYKVYCIQTTKELQTLQPLFSGINWIENNDVTTIYDFPTQKIYNLLNVLHSTVLLLNSDCEMVYKKILHTNKTIQFYLRWNYENNEIANEFEWGIDGILYTPNKSLPIDLPYGIGQPMWDYALPFIFQQNKIPFKINHYPWLFHQNHIQNWKEEFWKIGTDWLEQQYPNLTPNYFKNKFRSTLEPHYQYNKEKGLYENKSKDVADIQPNGYYNYS